MKRTRDVETNNLLVTSVNIWFEIFKFAPLSTVLELSRTCTTLLKAKVKYDEFITFYLEEVIKKDVEPTFDLPTCAVEYLVKKGGIDWLHLAAQLCDNVFFQAQQLNFDTDYELMISFLEKYFGFQSKEEQKMLYISDFGTNSVRQVDDILNNPTKFDEFDEIPPKGTKRLITLSKILASFISNPILVRYTLSNLTKIKGRYCVMFLPLIFAAIRTNKIGLSHWLNWLYWLSEYCVITKNNCHTIFFFSAIDAFLSQKSKKKNTLVRN